MFQQDPSCTSKLLQQHCFIMWGHTSFIISPFLISPLVPTRFNRLLSTWCLQGFLQLRQPKLISVWLDSFLFVRAHYINRLCKKRESRRERDFCSRTRQNQHQTFELLWLTNFGKPVCHLLSWRTYVFDLDWTEVCRRCQNVKRKSHRQRFLFVVFMFAHVF